MEIQPRSHTVINRLKLVFLISSAILVVSIGSAVFSIKKLVESSEHVNHTHSVIIESENLISSVKDVETHQRGYLLTHDPSFLRPYQKAKEKTNRILARLNKLTGGNEAQGENLDEIKISIEKRFAQLEKVISLSETNTVKADNNYSYIKEEILQGKKLMDSLRTLVGKINSNEKKLLTTQSDLLDTYTKYTPTLVILAAIVSLLITFLSYSKIKRELDARLKKQLEEELKYKETSERINKMKVVTEKIAGGDYLAKSEDLKEDELGRIATALNAMSVSLENNFNTLKNKNWLQEGKVKLGMAMRGERNIERLSSKILTCISNYLDSPAATLYISENSVLELSSALSLNGVPKKILHGEGLVGEAVKSKEIRILENIPAGFFIESSLGKSLPVALVIVPLIHENEAIAVMELGLLQKPGAIELEFITATAEQIAIALNSTLGYIKLQALLEETQAQTEELQTQHSELEILNAELESQTQKLQASEEELRSQQEELQDTNNELEERSALLEEKNMEIVTKAKELELSVRYKSEFLANMSHELRTPLNSILLLSRLLHDNPSKNLNNDQIEYAGVIQSSGKGLLTLIDEILDLSKIEAGKMELDYLDVPLKDIAEDLQSLFAAVANEKRLDFKIHLSPELPYSIQTDKGKLGQILKNLLSNAFKFTTNGSVSLEIKNHPTIKSQVAFVVKDTGIGIPEDKQELIFEAFQQADGSTRRKYGGTGLGLSISRELTKLLGGRLLIKSTPRQGSEFTLFVPADNTKQTGSGEDTFSRETDQTVSHSSLRFDNYVGVYIPDDIPDDRDTISDDDKVILIVEDDLVFANSLIEISHKKGFKVVCSVRGDEVAELTKKYFPTGILLDIQLPVKSGWEVINELKNDPLTRYIPVHMMSSYKTKDESLLSGAADFVNKPMVFEQIPGIFKKIEYIINRSSKKIIIIEDSPKHAKILAYYLEIYKITSAVKSNIPDAVSVLKNENVDCVILDMGIPDAPTYQFLEGAKKSSGYENIPVIIFTARNLSTSEELAITQYADSILVKTAHSYQKMLEEALLFLNLIGPVKKQGIQKNDYKKLGVLTEILKDKNVLLVDDDARNIFSLSKSLEMVNMNVITATNGKECLSKLEKHQKVDIILLDMMMPEMDGYETAKSIRDNSQWKDIPIIAVTAKAMAGDREKSISAGASDYITKPVDIDQLLSLLRVWLYD